MSITLRKFGRRPLVDLKSDQALKTLIRSELKDIINNSIQEYMQRTSVPVATIDINVDKDCHHGHYNSPNDTGRAVHLNISNSSVDILSETDRKNEDNEVSAKNEDNLHWMAWRTPDQKLYRTKSCVFRNSQSPSPSSAHLYRCSSPFTRSNCKAGSCNNNDQNRDKDFEQGRTLNGRIEAPRFMRTNSAMAHTRPRTSVAVGPDKHFEEVGTNTRRSYHISDYLRKNMDLNDPYERRVFSTLMEVMRKKDGQRCGDDSESGDMDPIVQISEYKHKFQNPRSKISFPTSSTQTMVTIKKPPICPHKSRLLGQLRPHTSSTSMVRSGEQFLY